MYFSQQSRKRLAAVTTGCLVMLCLLGLLSSTPSVQAKPRPSQQRSSYFSVDVGSDTYKFTAPTAPTLLYEPYYGAGNYLAEVHIPLMTAYLHGQKFGTVYGYLSTTHTSTETSSTVSLAITGFGGISTGLGIYKTIQWYPQVNLLAGHPNCSLAGPVAESQLGQTEGNVQCTSYGTSHIFGSTVDPVNRTQHIFYHTTNPVYRSFGASLDNVFTAIQAISNGAGQPSAVSPRAVLGNAMPLALNPEQRKGLGTVIGGTILTVLGNFLKNYCVAGDTSCAKQYHWLVLVGGAIADIGNGITIGGTLVFGVLPALQTVADRVGQAGRANMVANYLLLHPGLNAQQVGDIENQVGANFPQFRLHAA